MKYEGEVRVDPALAYRQRIMWNLVAKATKIRQDEAKAQRNLRSDLIDIFVDVIYDMREHVNYMPKSC